MQPSPHNAHSSVVASNPKAAWFATNVSGSHLATLVRAQAPTAHHIPNGRIVAPPIDTRRPTMTTTPAATAPSSQARPWWRRAWVAPAAAAAVATACFSAVRAFQRAVAENMRSPQPGTLAGWVARRRMRGVNQPCTEDAVRRLGVRDGDVVVEVGAGHGFGIRALAATGRRGLDVWAVEISPEFRAHLRASTDLPADRIVNADARALRFLADGSVDKVLEVNVVYFLDPLEDYLRELWRVLRPGGVALLACKWPAIHGAPRPFVNTEAGAVHAALRAAGFELDVVDVDLSRLGSARYSYQAVFCRKPPADADAQ